MLCKNQVVGKLENGRLYLHPCGQCLACRINDTRSWYVRSHFEVKKLERPFRYFVTLTYDDEHLPKDGLCNKEELKKFLNNLNTSFGLEMRYFATSDYGSINNRAHYHCIILSKKKITDKMVNRIWKKGFTYTKPYAKERMKYTLRYTVKKKPFPGEKPGWFRLISKGWGDNVAQYYTGQDYFVIDGKKYGIPDYCRKKIGLEKEPVLTYFNFASMLNSPQYQKGHLSDEKSLEDLQKLINVRRHLK